MTLHVVSSLVQHTGTRADSYDLCLGSKGRTALGTDQETGTVPFSVRAAAGLGVTRQALSELVNGRTGISVEMAIRLSKAFGSTPETWLRMQMAYDLWQARGRAEEIAVERFVAA